MKRQILTGIIALFGIATLYAQTSYEMVVEKTDGTKVSFKTNEVKQTYFQEAGNNTETYQGAKRIFGNALLASIYNETDNITEAWTYDSNGYPSKITSTSSSRNRSFLPSYADGQVIVKRYDGDTFKSQFTVTIGSNGYASKVEFVDDKGNSEVCTLTYNSDEQLSTITWGSDNVIQLTYSDGDVIRVNNNGSTYDVAYETTTQSKILNAGSFLLWDEMLHVDLDDLQELHFFGLLGKATKHLPLSYVRYGSSSTSYRTNIYETDSNGRVTMFTKTTRYVYSDNSESTSNGDVLRITWNE